MVTFARNQNIMNADVKKIGIRFGLIISGLGIAYYLIPYLIDPALLGNTYYGIFLWVMKITNLILLVVGVAQVRKLFGGFITFKDAFSTYMVGAIISVAIVSTFTILLFQVIDPEVVGVIEEATITSAVDLMEKFGAQEADIEKAIVDIEARFDEQYELSKQLLAIGVSIVVNAIIGLIVGLILKKDQPMWAAEEKAEIE